MVSMGAKSRRLLGEADETVPAFPSTMPIDGQPQMMTPCPKWRQQSHRGFAMIAMITMVAMISSFLLASAMSRTSSEVRLENDRRTQLALLEAKAALIGYAASLAWDNDPPTNAYDVQPGGLPCPSADEAGTAASSCATVSSRVGRLPWKKIGASDLRDGSGNVLWYALSANFVKNPGTTVINSDTQGTLTVTGTTPATNVVAVIIAPGAALSGQSRPLFSAAGAYSSGTALPAISAYLEGSNATNADTFVTATSSSDAFNDKLVTITQAELMAAVEPAVAARIERDVKPYLTDYYTLWGLYPFPVTFSPGPGTSISRAQSSYIGSSSATEGLLPVLDSTLSTYAWATGLGAVNKTGGAGTISGTPACAVSGTSWRCSFNGTGANCGSTLGCPFTITVNVNGQVTNVGNTLAKYTTGTGGSDFMRPASSVTTTGTTSVSSASIGISLRNTGNGRVRYSATLGYTAPCAASFLGTCTSLGSRAMSVTIPSDPATIYTWGATSTDPTDGWFIKGQWYRQVYYSVAPGYLPGGSGSCTAGTTCLTVSGLSSTTYPTTDDKRAVLVFMGRTLNGSTRPSVTLADYVENQNASTGDRVFEHISAVSSSINDRVIVVAP